MPGWLWTLLKVFLLAFVVIWFRVTYPRLRCRDRATPGVEQLRA
ncbi:NADH-quinone oxidoreductase subunit H [Nonomuraea sp. NPDC004297]